MRDHSILDDLKQSNTYYLLYFPVLAQVCLDIADQIN